MRWIALVFSLIFSSTVFAQYAQVKEYEGCYKVTEMDSVAVNPGNLISTIKVQEEAYFHTEVDGSPIVAVDMVANFKNGTVDSSEILEQPLFRAKFQEGAGLNIDFDRNLKNKKTAKVEKKTQTLYLFKFGTTLYISTFNKADPNDYGKSWVFEKVKCQ